MENIKEITDSFGNIHIVIYSSETEFISMPKTIYDAQQAQSTLPSNSSTPQAGA